MTDQQPEVRLAVLDFDGFMTDVWAEAQGFYFAYRQSVGDYVYANARELDPPLFSIAHEWRLAEQERERDPSKDDWIVEGIPVAPATDPLMAAGANAQIVLDKFDLLRDLRERYEQSQVWFKAHYKKTSTVFREGSQAAHSFLEALLARIPHVVIASNSEPDKVKQKLGYLDSHFVERIPVYGFAKKQVPTPSWDGRVETYSGMVHTLPESEPVEGLHRPVYLRRKNYADLLARLSYEYRVPVQNMRVAGDVYDLDLAVPKAMGIRTALMTRPQTRAYEKALAGCVVHNFAEARVPFGVR